MKKKKGEEKVIAECDWFGAVRQVARNGAARLGAVQMTVAVA